MNIAVRRHEAANLLGISVRQPGTWIAEGKVHKPYKISPRIVLFDVDRLRAGWARIRGETTQEDKNEWDEVL